MADELVSGVYGELTVTFQHAGPDTWTVTVYQRTLRIADLCQTFDTPQAAWVEAQRVATASFAGTPVGEIIADKPAELVLAEARKIVDSAERSAMAATRTALTPVDITYALWFVGGPDSGRTRREQESAVSRDGVWTYQRVDEPGTPWLVTHVPTGMVEVFGSLRRARAFTAQRPVEWLRRRCQGVIQAGGRTVGLVLPADQVENPDQCAARVAEARRRLAILRDLS
jgi:hypothetical protein